jgi:hypothetical protein
LVVEGDGGGEGEEALQDALPEAREGSGAVSLEGQGSLAAPEDALHALTDRREAWAPAVLVFAAGSDDRGVEFFDLASELFAGVALIANSSRATSRSSRLGEATVTARGVPSGAKKVWVSSRGESHPPALSEPDVTVSRHPAPIIQCWAVLGRQ